MDKLFIVILISIPIILLSCIGYEEMRKKAFLKLHCKDTGMLVMEQITPYKQQTNKYNFKVENQVGHFIVVKNLTFGFQIKPNLLHRFMSKILLGWIWVDENIKEKK